MRPPKFRPNRVIAFPIFSNMAAVRHFEFCTRIDVHEIVTWEKFDL